MSEDAPWWKGAVIYEIYVRSFLDTNGDGIGDLPGVIAMLDYVRGLGVDAIWLSPIHPSPNYDWGYDVSDYHGVHRDFGTIADLDRLIAEAHRRGIKVLLDGVLSHTSDQHPWFQQSLKSHDGTKANWYVWEDPKPDGTPPNNWLSAFGGPAWSYHPARQQYYHHKFLRQQPKLNWHNIDVRAAALDVLSYWLQRGVDGFRLDVANSYLHDEMLTDNPPIPIDTRTDRHWSHAPLLQRHIHDSNLRENRVALDEIRLTVEKYPDRFVFGEFYEDAEIAGGYLPSDRGLHSGYDFGLLELNSLNAEAVTSYFQMHDRYAGHWPCLAFSNHDIVRTVTRLGGEHAGREFANVALALLFSSRGTVLLFQGEELGLPQSDIPFDLIHDPLGRLYFPYSKGRDGCRTPMPWDADRTMCGFSSSTPWLPVDHRHRSLAVSSQENDKTSPLHLTRDLAQLRRMSVALRLGQMVFVDAKNLLVFERKYEKETVLCVFNLTPAPDTFSHVGLSRAHMLLASGARAEGRTLCLEPFGFWLGKL